MPPSGSKVAPNGDPNDLNMEPNMGQNGTLGDQPAAQNVLTPTAQTVLGLPKLQHGAKIEC